MVASDVARLFGGRAIRSSLDLARAVERGLPVEAADALVAGGALGADELYTLVIPRRTLAHRRARGERLTVSESDRLARVARAVACADETFGAPATAHTWLRRPNRELDGAAPLDLLSTEPGARAIEAVLERLAHGVHA